MRTTKSFKYTSKLAKDSDDSFIALQKKWYKILSQSGFKDQENKHGELKRHETRTIAWANRDKIRDFFLKLDEYLTKHGHEISIEHRTVLGLYTQGLSLGEICKLVKPCRTKVAKIIREYKQRILAD